MLVFCRITFVIWLALSLGVYLAKHGERKEGTYNFWSGFISAVIQMLLLWGGGFFS